MRYYLIPMIVLILFIMGAIEWNHNKMNPCLPDGFPDGRAALGLQPITCFVD